MKKNNENKKKLPPVSKLFPIFLLISTIFMGIGYAAINSIILEINGSATAMSQSNLFIEQINYVSSTNAEPSLSSIINTYKTTMQSTITLSNTKPDSQITYSVIIRNPTNKIYRYMGTTYENDCYDNQNIKVDVAGVSIGDKLNSGEYITLLLTFSYIDSVNFENENFTNILNSWLNFDFEIDANPILADNMVPVYYENGEWKITNKADTNWHDYYSGKWANAVTFKNDVISNNVEPINTEIKNFNGSSDYMILGNNSTDFGKSISVVARVKLHTHSTSESGIIGNPEGAGFYMMKSGGNNWGFEIYDETAKKYVQAYTDYTIELNRWYTLVGTYDGKSVKLYIDGEFIKETKTTGKIKISEAPIAIGGNPNENNEITGGYFDGIISEVAVIKEVLTKEEIAQNYNSILKHQPDKSSTLYYLKFDGNDAYSYQSATYTDDGMVFDGVDDYAMVGYSAYDFKNTFTVGARVKIDTYSDTEYGIVGNPQSAGLYLLKSAGNKHEIIVYDSTLKDYRRVESPTTFELNKWYTVVATYDGSALTLYVDGKKVNSLSVKFNMKVCNIPFMIGVNPTINSTLGGGYLDGTISDMILIDEALTASQISQYYSNDVRTVISDKTIFAYDFRSYSGREEGSSIPDKVINTMWTWIPRFNAINPTNEKVDLRLVDVEEDAHDAFTFDSNELEGFWIGKFENSIDNVYDNVDTYISIKPNTSSYQSKNISTMFNTISNISNLTNEYGFDKTKHTLLDTHLSKNNEWAAVAYLTQSKYGLCSAEVCKTLESNNTLYTGGNDYITNINQSTTNNITGVYDLYGGVSEIVMGNYNNTLNSNDGFTSIPDSKYINVYTTGEDYTLDSLQHALLETKDIFNVNESVFVNSTNNWLARNNLFSYTSTSGAALEGLGSRTTLIVIE